MRFLRSMEWKKKKIWKQKIKKENKYLDDKVINNRIQLHGHVEREKERRNKWLNEQTNAMKEWVNKHRNKQMNEEMTPKKILNMTLKGKHLKGGLGSWREQVKKDVAQKEEETWQKLVEEKLWTGTDRQRTCRTHIKWRHWEVYIYIYIYIYI